MGMLPLGHPELLKRGSGRPEASLHGSAQLLGPSIPQKRRPVICRRTRLAVAFVSPSTGRHPRNEGSSVHIAGIYSRRPSTSAPFRASLSCSTPSLHALLHLLTASDGHMEQLSSSGTVGTALACQEGSPAQYRGSLDIGRGSSVWSRS